MLALLCMNWIWELGHECDQTMQAGIWDLTSNLMKLGLYWVFYFLKCRIEDKMIINSGEEVMQLELELIQSPGPCGKEKRIFQILPFGKEELDIF